MDKGRQEALSGLLARLGLSGPPEELLDQALVHSSFAYEEGLGTRHNERMEFLGDAVLDLAVSEYLYERFPDHTEGELAKARAAVVCAPALAEVARSLKLGDLMKLGRGERRSGGHERDSLLSDALEAVIAAIYLSYGWGTAAQVVVRLLDPMIVKFSKQADVVDAKTTLQEILQEKVKATPSYHLIDATGPDHAKVFSFEVRVQGKTLGHGQGRSKKEAEQEAARMALRSVEKT